MTPPESHESDPFDTRPSLPLGNFQTDWPGLDLSTPYPAAVDSAPPPPPVGKIVMLPERRRWLYSTQALAIGLLSLAVIVLSLVILSFHQGGIVGFFSNSSSSSTTNVQNTTATGNIPVSTSIPSGAGSTSSTPANPAATATTAAVNASPSSTTTTSTSSTPTAVLPTATSTSVPAPTVIFTCQSVSGGKGTPGPKNVTQICVQTSPGIHVTIAATKCDGSPDDNLQQTSGTADSAGDFQWSWTMQDPGPCKQEHITVTAQASSGQTGQNAIYLQFMH